MQTLVSVLFLILTGGILLAVHKLASCREGAWAWLLKAAIVMVAAMSFARYTYLPPFGQLDVRPANLHDFTHYFIGAKYFPELGYDRMYSCISEALALPDDVPVRDLVTKSMSSAALVRAAAPCRPHFSDERWAAFQFDAQTLRNMMGGAKFRGFLRDHGFNPSPAWLLLAKPLASTVSVSTFYVMVLGAVDVGLLALAILMVGWGFGTFPTALATVILTTLPAASPEWTIGSFLRWDWLLALSLMPVFLRRGYFAAAGAALGVAIALRIFPVIAVLFIGCFLVVQHVRGGPIDPRWRRFWIGLVATGFTIFAITAAVEGPGAISAFSDNLLRHAAKASSNDMGLRTVLSHLAAVLSGSTGDLAVAANKAQTFSWILPVYLAIAGVCFWMATTVGASPPWVTGCLALLFIPMGWQEISNYYYQFWFVVALLGAWRAWIGGTFLVANLLMQVGFASFDPGALASFTAQSVIVCCTVAFISLALRFRPQWR